jgi:hypothetical protein
MLGLHAHVVLHAFRATCTRWAESPTPFVHTHCVLCANVVSSIVWCACSAHRVHVLSRIDASRAYIVLYTHEAVPVFRGAPRVGAQPAILHADLIRTCCVLTHTLLAHPGCTPTCFSMHISVVKIVWHASCVNIVRRRRVSTSRITIVCQHHVLTSR